MRYLLDANVFIEAKNLYYAFDICPGFWSWMDSVVGGQGVGSIVGVRDELIRGHDELAAWVTARKSATWFLPQNDPATTQVLGRIADSIQRGKYTDAAKAEFMSGADPWLAAKAKVVGATVVTMERLDRAARRKVFLPNICADEGVATLSTFEFLRKLGAQFEASQERAAKPKK